MKGDVFLVVVELGWLLSNNCKIFMPSLPIRPWLLTTKGMKFCWFLYSELLETSLAEVTKYLSFTLYEGASVVLFVSVVLLRTLYGSIALSRVHEVMAQSTMKVSAG